MPALAWLRLASRQPGHYGYRDYDLQVSPTLVIYAQVHPTKPVRGQDRLARDPELRTPAV